MKIYPISDLHLDCNGPIASALSMSPSQDSVVVLAGDLASWAVYSEEDRNWITTEKARKVLHDTVRYFSEKCRHVVIVLGNHDYNGTIIDVDGKKYSSLKLDPNPLINYLYDFSNLGNVSVLHEGASVQVDEVLFIGATLWTDVRKLDPYSLMIGKGLLRCDFESTRARRNKNNSTITEFSPHDWVDLHARDKEGIENSLERWKDAVSCDGYSSRAVEKRVMVTHMPPFTQSCSPAYRNHPADAYFTCSDMDHLAGAVDLWIHGHTHTAFDYMAGDTRVVCNPYGTGNQWTSNGFKLDLEIEV